MGEVRGIPSPPDLLADRHQIVDFNSGDASLDDWLNPRARANQVSGASRTYVLCGKEHVVGYYALASGVVTVESASSRFKRNMPNPIPGAVLARLAVDRDWQGGASDAPYSGTPRAASRTPPMRSGFAASWFTRFRSRRKVST
jgi:hypothetical protein